MAKIISFTLQALLWFLFILAPFIDSKHPVPTHFDFLVPYFFNQLMYLFLFYLNYFYLLPKILYAKSLRSYVLIISPILILFYFLPHIFNKIYLDQYIYLKNCFSNIVPLIQVYFVSVSFKLLTDQIEIAYNKKVLQEEKLKAVLNYLRSQINPHFLYNTLNNITALVHINPDSAEQSIIKLSKIMRVMFSTEDSQQNTITKEIDLINNYIDLQKIRLNEDTELIYSVEGVANNKHVEPLILINFIENVFKHGINDVKCSIFINIKLEENKLTLVTKNQINKDKKDSVTGVGLSNVRKRLEIVYPNKHLLNIFEKDNFYNIELQIELN